MQNPTTKNPSTCLGIKERDKFSKLYLIPSHIGLLCTLQTWLMLRVQALKKADLNSPYHSEQSPHSRAKTTAGFPLQNKFYIQIQLDIPRNGSKQPKPEDLGEPQ